MAKHQGPPRGRSANSLAFDKYVNHIRTGKGKAGWFWNVQDLADIAKRWGTGIPAEHIHIVTVPQDASDPTLLWQRYTSVLGVDPASCDVDIPKKNVSLGCVEAEVLRRIHSQRDSRFQAGAWSSYAAWTRRLLADQTLGQRRSAPFGLSEDDREWISERTADMVDTIRDRGHHVVGDLERSRLAAASSEREADVVCHRRGSRRGLRVDDRSSAGAARATPARRRTPCGRPRRRHHRDPRAARAHPSYESALSWRRH